MQAEEQRRSWWTLLLLDRYLGLGAADRKLLTTCPGQDAILPADDGTWEAGDHTQSQPHRLREPLSRAMGRFCLTAQVAILLERIMQNINDTSSQDEFREQEADILDDAVAALTSVALQEARSRGISVCSPITACYSARFLLHDPERTGTRGPSRTSDDASHSLAIESNIATDMLNVAQAVSNSKRCGEEEFTPFCLEAHYRSGIFFAHRYQTDRNEDDLKAFETIKRMLGMVKTRWRLAGLYEQMLEARRFSDIL